MGSFEEGFNSTYDLRMGFARALPEGLADYYEGSTQSFAYLSPFGDLAKNAQDTLWKAAETDDNARFILGVIARAETVAAGKSIEAVPGDILNEPIPTPPRRRERAMTVMDFAASSLKAELRLELMRLDAARKEFNSTIVKTSTDAQRQNDRLSYVKFDQA